jgi:hypothetical protein
VRRKYQEEEIMSTKTSMKKSPKSLPPPLKRPLLPKLLRPRRKFINDDYNDIDVTNMLGDMALDKKSPNFCLKIKGPWKMATFIKTVNEIQSIGPC